MSWGFETTGTKDAVKAKLSEYCQRVAKMYEGKPESDDILTFESRAHALIDALELGVDASGNDWNGVNVKGSGSHSTNDAKVWSATMSMSVTRTCLAL